MKASEICIWSAKPHSPEPDYVGPNDGLHRQIVTCWQMTVQRRNKVNWQNLFFYITWVFKEALNLAGPLDQATSSLAAPANSSSPRVVTGKWLLKIENYLWEPKIKPGRNHKSKAIKRTMNSKSDQTTDGIQKSRTHVFKILNTTKKYKCII